MKLWIGLFIGLCVPVLGYFLLGPDNEALKQKIEQERASLKLAQEELLLKEDSLILAIYTKEDSLETEFNRKKLIFANTKPQVKIQYITEFIEKKGKEQLYDEFKRKDLVIDSLRFVIIIKDDSLDFLQHTKVLQAKLIKRYDSLSDNQATLQKKTEKKKFFQRKGILFIVGGAAFILGLLIGK